MAEPVHIIANPNAAGGRGARMLPRLHRLLREREIAYSSESTRGPGDGRVLARRLGERGASRILVVGGDGTLHEVANGLLESSSGGDGAVLPPLAVFPVGTGNDFHRMTRAPGDLPGVVSLLTSGAPRAFDVGRVRWDGGEEYFVNLLGMGIDVEVLRRRNRFGRLPGLLQYGAALVSAAARFEHLPLTVEVKGEGGGPRRWESTTLLTAVTVGPSVAGGFMLAPEALPDDGLLDLFQVEGIGFFGLMRHLPRVVRGTHAEIRGVRMEQVRRVRIESRGEHPIYFELDGELMPEPSPWLEIEVSCARLPVLERAETSTDEPDESRRQGTQGAHR